MKGSNVSQPARGAQRAATVLGVLFIISLVLMVASFGYVSYHGRFDREYISRADAIRVLSQTIGKNASETANGKTDAFFMLEAASQQLEAHANVLVNGDPAGSKLPATAAVSEEAERALSKVIRTWSSVRGNVDDILARRQMVIAVNELGERFRANAPRLQSMSEELVDRLVAAGGERAQIAVAARQVVAAERIGRHLGEMLQGGIGNITAAERLGYSAEEFARGVNALLRGDSELGVVAVADARARQQLEAINNLYSGMQAEVNEVLARSPELFRVRNAADNIFTDTSALLATTDHLLTRYAELENTRPIQWWFGFAFGAAAIVLLLVRGLAVRAVSRAELAAKEEERNRTDEVSRRNQEAILNLLDEIEGLKEGDLTKEASVGEEITGAIADAFNDATDALRNLVMTINETSVQVSSAAQQTQATAMHLAEASDHQAHQITAVSAAVNEMAVSIDQVSRNAEESARVAQQSVNLATRGADTVRRTIEGMDGIREQIQETSKRIKRLGESSQEIGNIVELINDIADQTNILALNASIQAAMAGEAGRGFAVVADEVQRLAERSGNATKQIEALVKTIQTDTNEAVISMEQSTAGVVSGAKLAEAAGDALREIELVSKQLAGLIQNISEAARQQANAAANISDTMNVIQEITSQTSAGTNETATSIGNLADLANELRNSVAGFKLPE
ncbi:MAG TPA: methyl-accepting chemotaxis protein [Gammaproteobacteria bacterium]|nr:methyl-accepting chemotaxis protein [Gammaproteobacteria bacterium]